MHVRIALLAAPLLLANTDPPPLPPTIKAMLDAAMASGNEGEVATVAKYARAAAPDAAPAITAAIDRSEERRVGKECS